MDYTPAILAALIGLGLGIVAIPIVIRRGNSRTLKNLAAATDEELDSWPQDTLWKIQVIIEDRLKSPWSTDVSEEEKESLEAQKQRAVKALGRLIIRDMRTQERAKEEADNLGATTTRHQ